MRNALLAVNILAIVRALLVTKLVNVTVLVLETTNQIFVKSIVSSDGIYIYIYVYVY